MPSYSIAFVIVMLILGFLVGGVFGALLQRLFGFSFLALKLFDIIIEDFYLIQRIHLVVTTGALLGVILNSWYVYRMLR